jgi:hypothetical protein
MGIAQPPGTRRGHPGRSGLIHGAVGPLSSRTTGRQPVVTIERTGSVHPLSRSSHRRPATFDAPRCAARQGEMPGREGQTVETMKPALLTWQDHSGRAPCHRYRRWPEASQFGRTSMTNPAPTSGAVAWQRLGRVTGVAGLAATVLIFGVLRPEPPFAAAAAEFLTHYRSPDTVAAPFRSFVLTVGLSPSSGSWWR